MRNIVLRDYTLRNIVLKISHCEGKSSNRLHTLRTTVLKEFSLCGTKFLKSTHCEDYSFERLHSVGNIHLKGYTV